MTNPKCAVCGHINRMGAVVCEMCDTRLGEPAEAGAADSSRASEESSERYADSSAEDFGASAGGFEPGGAESREGAEPTYIPSPEFKSVGDYGEAADAVVALLVQSIIGGMLSASSVVLDVYIFLGLLRERGEGFTTRIFTPAPEAAAR